MIGRIFRSWFGLFLAICVMLGGIFLMAHGANASTTRISPHAFYKMPYCDPDLDVCLENIRILKLRNPDGHEGGEIISGQITLHTHTLPIAFGMTAYLQKWNGRHGKWDTEDSQNYRKAKLPRVGKTQTLKPFLETYCVPRSKWRIYAVVNSVSSSGVAQTQYIYYPGKNAHEFIGTTEPLKKDKYNIRIKNCET
jgi:hypothetical protein